MVTGCIYMALLSKALQLCVSCSSVQCLARGQEELGIELPILWSVGDPLYLVSHRSPARHYRNLILRDHGSLYVCVNDWILLKSVNIIFGQLGQRNSELASKQSHTSSRRSATSAFIWSHIFGHHQLLWEISGPLAAKGSTMFTS